MASKRNRWIFSLFPNLWHSDNPVLSCALDLYNSLTEQPHHMNKVMLFGRPAQPAVAQTALNGTYHTFSLTLCALKRNFAFGGTVEMNCFEISKPKD
jgi:hypothetical protein